jgi:hypothetical protein
MAIPKKPKAPESLDDVIMSGKATQIDLASAAATTEKKKVGRKKLEPSKTVGFRLPLRLIELIVANAEEKTAGNQSAFIIKVLEGKEKLEEIG